ncbi:HNH endonuclease [Bacillus sp. EB106-08-02-XG196]|uniref:HNH endonuclease n=1 Tax=Bacillus sp. EB106-08-02-XG196 TaxID=2737049 RepID=UPI0015C4700F|nr:HNH endonuclease [Bacillus sp. EB106-08-02-XG196]NWQ40385.1 HNH endonuclease [Bacillus sp. EB106-08-02-XG196]
MNGQMEQRTCRICNEVKVLGQFEIDRRYKDGHFTSRCKACKSATQSKAARALQHMREKAAKEGREVEVTLNEIETLFETFDSCAYCGKKQSESDEVFHIEHIIPRSAGGADTLSNLTVSCPEDNHKKGVKPIVAYFFENRERMSDARFVLLAHYVSITSGQPVEDVAYDMANQFADYEMQKINADLSK